MGNIIIKYLFINKAYLYFTVNGCISGNFCNRKKLYQSKLLKNKKNIELFKSGVKFSITIRPRM